MVLVEEAGGEGPTLRGVAEELGAAADRHALDVGPAGAALRDDVNPRDVLTVSIEAGTTIGWERYTGRSGLRFGIDSFGASAPIEALYDHFGLTADKITPQIIARLG